MKKIKVFTNHYYPENFKINELSKEMSKYYELEVISQTPNYPKGDFLKGYSWFKNQTETLEGIEIKRLPVIPRKSGGVMLLLNYLSYILSSFIYSVFTRDKADHVFVYITSPIFISWAGLRFAKRNHIPSTLYLLDLWPGSLISILKIENKRVIGMLEKMCIKIYRRFDTIVVSSKGFVEVLSSYGIEKSKIHYIPQHAEISKKKAEHLPPQIEGLKIVFTGNIGQAQGLDVLIETAAYLSQENFTSVHFNIVGDGRYRSTLEEKIKKSKLEDYFTFTGYVNPNMISDILENNHFGFVSLSDHDIFNRTLPAKVQSYMANGMPMLASANGEVPRLIEEAKCGYSVDAGDSKALAKLIMDILTLDRCALEIMSENSYNYSAEYFNKANIVKKFVNIMKEGKKNV